MKNTTRLFVTALISLVFSGLGFAQAKRTTPATPSVPASKETKTESQDGQATVLTGKVTSVDAKAGKLTMKVKEKEITLATDSRSTKAALEKLKVGDLAKVFVKDGKAIAVSAVKAESQTKTPK